MKLDHIAIIMDGNRRWAIANNLSSYEGHKKGAENLWNIINNIQEFKLKFLTCTALISFHCELASTIFSLSFKSDIAPKVLVRLSTEEFFLTTNCEVLPV